MHFRSQMGVETSTEIDRYPVAENRDADHALRPSRMALQALVSFTTAVIFLLLRLLLHHHRT